MPARIEGKHGIAAGERAEALRKCVHLLAVAREPVQEDDPRPPSGGRRAVGEVQRRRDRDAVVHRDGDVQLRRGGRGGVADEEGERACQRR
jgi:hypothetical protein